MLAKPAGKVNQSYSMSDIVEDLFYQTEDGLSCHYRLWPNRQSNSCCLLLHGFTNDAHIWDDTAAKLQAMHNVIALDFRGHGDSAWDPRARYTHPQLVADTRQLIKQQTFDRWHIIGHSLGARVAMLMLAEQPDMAASLTMIDTGPEVRAVGVNKVRKDAENMPREFASVDAYFEFLSGIYWLAEPEKLRQIARHGLRQEDNGRWLCKTDPAFTAALWKPQSQQGNSDDLRYPMQDQLWQALGHLRCPALVMRGQASAILSAQVAQRMVETIPEADLITINRAGHAVMVDNPAEFDRAVVDFIREV